VAIDQEGGLVQRLRAPLTVWPDMFSVGAAGNPARTEQVGRALGQELAALGIGWDFAPVLDVHTNPDNPVIGNRSFGTTPEAVAAHALAFWRGLRSAGVLGCGKHFPGHGDTHTDSHLELPVVDHPMERLRAVELAPFAAAARAGMEAIMTAHVLFPALDPDRPATLSRRVLTDLLRGELGFAGVMPERQQRAHEALVRAGERDAGLRRRIEESAGRVAALKAAARVGPPAPAAMLASLLGPPAHRALAGSFPSVAPHSPAASSPVVES
jgi:beta-N-acetylhexosaminidase